MEFTKYYYTVINRHTNEIVCPETNDLNKIKLVLSTGVFSFISEEAGAGRIQVNKIENQNALCLIKKKSAKASA